MTDRSADGTRLSTAPKRSARCCFCLRFVLMVGIVRLLVISTLSRLHAYIVSSLGLCRLRRHHYKHTILLVKRVIYFRFAGLSPTGAVERQQNIHRTFIYIVLWQDQVSYSEESPVGRQRMPRIQIQTLRSRPRPTAVSAPLPRSPVDNRFRSYQFLVSIL